MINYNLANFNIPQTYIDTGQMKNWQTHREEKIIMLQNAITILGGAKNIKKVVYTISNVLLLNVI